MKWAEDYTLIQTISHYSERIMVSFGDENLNVLQFPRQHGAEDGQKPSLCVAVFAENHGTSSGVGIQDIVMRHLPCIHKSHPNKAKKIGI